MKKLAVAVLLVAAVLGGVAYWAWSSLDLIVRIAIEHYAPQLAGVPVKVGGIDISAASGRGVVRNLEIGSPHGFTAPYAARVGEIRVALDPETVTGAVVHVRSLTVESPLITYERGDRGTNVEAIRRNLEGYIARSGGPSESRPAEAKPGRRKFVVDRLSIRGGRVTMTNPALRGQGIRFGLPDIELRDVGRREGGLTASEIAQLVAAQLEARIAQRVLSNVELLRKGGVEGAIDALKGLLH
ncbi:MAG TPA: hypothetical protein VLS49_09600 [Usitatibacter sp.]|nr:hypothetical protein [Usitatibacter sp.]